MGQHLEHQKLICHHLKTISKPLQLLSHNQHDVSKSDAYKSSSQRSKDCKPPVHFSLLRVFDAQLP